MDSFDQCFAVVLGSEAGYSDNPNDPGNWTEGRVGRGICKGTKFGISASAYPTLDIPTLDQDQAKTLYRRDYWEHISGDSLPPPLALLVFDAAVNSGVHRSVIWLQEALSVAADGVVGPATLAAIEPATHGSGGGINLCSEYLSRRLLFMTGLPSWNYFGAGWARRLFRLPYQSITVQ